MNCDECKTNPAAVHIAQMANGQQVEMHLCLQCAAQKGLGLFNMGDAFSLPKLLGSFFGYGPAQSGQQSPVEQGEKCLNCGTSFDQIAHQGRLGCSQCYEEFQNQLEPILRRVHGNSLHIGKIPQRGAGKVKLKREIDQLKASLQACIAEERYEKAAELRDVIKKLEKETETR
ncbi:MAG: UvrB/UvrC motif-containing protein [Ignavibacteriales bacterium]